MHLQLFHIIPLLQPYIREICIMEFRGHVNPVFRVLPDTCVELFINYHEQPIGEVTGKTTHNTTRSFVNSRMSSYMDVQMYAQAHCIAVCFRPGMAHRFFSIPMSEITDTSVPLSELWKQETAEMEERLFEAENNDERVTILQQYLLAALIKKQKENLPVTNCLQQLNKLKGQMKVAELAAEANLGERQLGRKFSECIGLSPKEFIRINRFIHTLDILKNKTGSSLTEIAYEGGYYDQAHFIHDCREYSGHTPGALVRSAHILY